MCRVSRTAGHRGILDCSAIRWYIGRLEVDVDWMLEYMGGRCRSRKMTFGVDVAYCRLKGLLGLIHELASM